MPTTTEPNRAARRFPVSPRSDMLPGEEENELWRSQLKPWLQFFKKARGISPRRRKTAIQTQARAEIDRSIAAVHANPETSFPPLACRSGCAFCCHFSVSITDLEAERLAALVREMPDDRRAEMVERLRSAKAAFELSGRANYGHPCPFLEDNRCSVYEDRPLYCRSHVSVNAAVCQGELAATTPTVNDASLGVKPGTLRHNVGWHILLNPIATAAIMLIGKTGQLPAMVLHALESRSRP